jgi:glyoxylase-like metal-dependent hydrolase (beta-lactamase superfamily II)
MPSHSASLNCTDEPQLPALGNVSAATIFSSIAPCASCDRASWHWQTSHPDWRPSEPWDQNVSSYAIDDDERLLLFDPLGVPSEIEALAGERETAIVLTAPWHERDAQRLVERLGVPVYTPLPDTAQDLMDMYGLTAEQAGDGSPDLVWLLREKKGEARPYSSGDRLPFGADVFPGHKANDTVLWVESQRAVISGDTLGDFGRGLEINERWLRPGVTREEIAEGLRPLLALPVEHVLATHGGPTDRAALERALSSS